MRFILVAALLAACGPNLSKAKNWQQKKVFVALDSVHILMEIRRVADTGMTVTAGDIRNPYLLMQDHIVVWRNEADIPSGTTYWPMPPAQAFKAAQNTDGPGGVCVAEGNNCTTRLTRGDLAEMEKDLEKLPDETFLMVRKPG